MSKLETIVLKEGDDIRLTVPGAEGTTCVYLSNIDGKIVITGGGGADIIKRIDGSGMAEKISKQY